MQKTLEILEYINIGITLLFLIVYLYRLFHLRHFAITERYKSKYPRTRIILCIPYVVLSVPFLVISILKANQSSSNSFWVIQFGVGECIDSIILIIQLFVLRQELNKQRPYTPIHLLFCIYLTIISIVRLIFVAIDIGADQLAANYIFMGFYLAFLINAVLLLGYWIAKKQQLPQFQKYNYFNFSEFQNLNSTRYMNRNIQISYLKKASQSFSYIRPTVSVEKGKFRIVLQIYDSKQAQQLQDQKAKTQVQNRSTLKKGHQSSNLRIISNNLYTMSQILQLYKICGRFSISQKLFFDTHNFGQMYKNLQNYLDELFANKKNYLKFVLNFFQINEQFMQGCDRALRQTFKDSQMDIYAKMDKNASIISVNINKQLWMDDYYLFYMDVVAIDGRVQSRPMRRYNDFQMFHSQLQSIIKRRYGGSYILPTLPKKYLFNWDQSKITQRRNQLQAYLRSLTNDYKLMLEFHQIRQATLLFLGFYQVINLQPVNQQFKSFYKNIQILKGSISKQLTNSQYVTYYQFKVLYNGIPIRSIKKRFSEFIALHQSIERWMNNVQINYKFLVLPQKHINKSNAARHQKLKGYLQAVLTIQDVWKIYQVNAFLQVGDNTMKDISMSGIHSPDQELRTKKNYGINEEDDHEIMTQKFIDQQSFQSKGRMSALIEQLGNN